MGLELPGVITTEGLNIIPDSEAGTGRPVGLDGLSCEGVAVGTITTGGIPPLDDPGLGTIEGSVSLEEMGSGVGTTGTSVVNVVCRFETVVGVDETGAAPLLSPAMALEIAPTGLLIGTAAVKVVCELEIVTGTEITGAAPPLETPANAVEMAPAGLLIGTLAVKVVSGLGMMTGIDTTAECDSFGVCTALFEASAVWVATGKCDMKVVSGFEIVIFGGTLDGLLESDASTVSEDRTPPGFEIGTVAVSVWSDFEITTGIDTTEGSEPLFEGCAKAVEIAPPGLEIGTAVTTVASERDIVTGTDRTGDLLVVSACPELAPSLVLGLGLTPSVLVVSACPELARSVVLGLGLTPSLLVLSACPELAPSVVFGFGLVPAFSVVVGFGMGCWSVFVFELLC